MQSPSPAATAVSPRIKPTAVTTPRHMYVIFINPAVLPAAQILAGTKLRLVWYTRVHCRVDKPSMLEEAVFPAMAMEPKELTED